MDQLYGFWTQRVAGGAPQRLEALRVGLGLELLGGLEAALVAFRGWDREGFTGGTPHRLEALRVGLGLELLGGLEAALVAAARAPAAVAQAQAGRAAPLAARAQRQHLTSLEPDQDTVLEQKSSTC